CAAVCGAPEMTAPSRTRPLPAPRVERNRTIRNGDAEGRPDGAFNEASVAAMGANQLGGDRKAKACAARASGALERLEEMRAGTLRQPRPGIGDFDHGDRALAPAGDADLILSRMLHLPAFERLHRVARKIEQDAKQLIGIRVDHEPALDRADPAHRRALV